MDVMDQDLLDGNSDTRVCDRQGTWKSPNLQTGHYLALRSESAQRGGLVSASHAEQVRTVLDVKYGQSPQTLQRRMT